MRDAHTTADAVVALGGLTLDFGRVDRVTYHQDGVTPESDTDHTVMLGLIACALADQHFPHLNVGLIAQYALVHDLVEVYAGDTPTLRMPTDDAKAEKQHREHEAWRRIGREFGKTLPWVSIMIGGYEAKTTPEARFVKALDKLLPKITHILNGAVTIHKQGMTPAELAARYETQIGEMEAYAADFPELFKLRAVLVSWVLQLLAQQEDSVARPAEHAHRDDIRDDEFWVSRCVCGETTAGYPTPAASREALGEHLADPDYPNSAPNPSEVEHAADDSGCPSCGACGEHGGCAYAGNESPSADDCASCGACSGCIAECSRQRTGVTGSDPSSPEGGRNSD